MIYNTTGFTVFSIEHTCLPTCSSITSQNVGANYKKKFKRLLNVFELKTKQSRLRHKYFILLGNMSKHKEGNNFIN